MAAVLKVRQGTLLGAVLLLVFGLSCAEPRSTQPNAGDLAFAKGGGSDPTVTSADPAEAPQDSTLDVHILGTNYDQGSKVDFARAGVVDPKLQVNSTTYLSSTELLANVSVAADAAPVSYDVMVTKSTGKKGIGTEKFAVLVSAEVLNAPSGFSDVYGVSDNGLIAGRVTVPCGPGWGPAVWDQLGQLTALPALPGTCGGVATDINSAGVVVGMAYIGSAFSSDVRWVPSGGTYQVEALPRLPDGSLAGAMAINEAGSVAAMDVSAVWSESTGWQMLQLPSGATRCSGYPGINNLEAVVAKCTVAGQNRAALWASPTAAPILLPLPAGTSAVSVRDINDAGVIVGWTSISLGRNKFVNRATQWAPSGGSWTVTFLPDLGSGSAAFAINNSGQVSGSAQAPPNGILRPVFWGTSGTLQLLEGHGEALGLSEATDGPVVAGYVVTVQNKVAARWQP